ncbi:hypothetical protein BS47DRAFT_1369795 [Hydnum rufescens UP504]|uniref:Uncharacterized protein n=1 Tax=Hydnum rufescens UP504 TaxID=1448309 RepID=A0A9P6ADS4_9AGAM|nr:hypothetical protein BS47DRAFT_1369795 [Hydnum rufescens UP504]
MPAAVGVWSKGTEYATNKKTLDDEATTRENAPTDWLHEPHTRCGRAVGLHPQPACHELKTRDLPNEPQRPAKRTSPRKRQRHPPQQYGPNETRQTKPGNGETPDGTTHSLRRVCGSIQGYHLNYPLNGSRKRDLPRNGNTRRKTAGTPDEPHTRFGGVLSEPTSRPATLPNTHTREWQPARQTEPETREVNQPPKQRRRSPIPSTNRVTAVQNKYHTPTSVVPHTCYGGRYHTPARVGWSIRTKQGII